MSRWNNHGRYHGGFPASVHTQARRELPAQCAHCHTNGVPLWLDHIRNKATGGTDTIENAQWLCAPCHDAKTQSEAAAGQQARTARGHRPPEPHPGLIN